uniref:Uncharacterized protein n=1 Tax=viral metagenome TaxID=1070528 RepID=A0A6C0JSQ5_9ZZZZ
MTEYIDGKRKWQSKITDRDLGSGWVEPGSAANEETQPEYPFNNVQQTESGHLFELDDTPNRERIRLQHRMGTFIEMHPNGDEVHKVYGDGYEITICDKNIEVRGHCSVIIKGDSVITVEGNKTEKIKGNYDLVVDGDFNHAVKGDCNILSESDMQIGAGGSLSDVAGIGTGSLTLLSGQDISVAGDFMVEGGIVADMVTAKYSVDAGLGITAGPLGFVTMLGGVSVGIPVAIPGQVNAIEEVNAPLANFGIMNAVLMHDIINSKIYNTHIHKTKVGPTSPPKGKFV